MNRISRQIVLHLLLVLLLLVMTGCDRPRLIPLSADATILAFGDSLTYGTGAQRTESYPASLAEITGRTVINAGVPGEISASGLKRLPEALAEHQPRLLILCHGGNDFLRRLGAEETAANIRAMIALARAQGVEVVLVGVPQLGLFIDTAPLYAQLAKELELPFAEDVISDILTDRELKSDTIHPNAAGYRKIAEALATLLKKSGALQGR
ncbi:MAG: arylesterase [Desulfuromonadales bacterium]|nr:arylesterase [Desulfuromonadales bacterium]MDT8423159.1 arylesterase [Desulfuromonadales bacterium]